MSKNKQNSQQSAKHCVARSNPNFVSTSVVHVKLNVQYDTHAKKMSDQYDMGVI